MMAKKKRRFLRGGVGHGFSSLKKKQAFIHKE